LLDYVEPPDLEHPRHRFQLPVLRDENIFCTNFFKPNAACHDLLKKNDFAWIVGNPPWKKLNPQKLKPNDEPVWEWMIKHARPKPVGGNQTARAFAWKVINHVAPNGWIALLLPAMTLFEEPCKEFRSAFLEAIQLNAVANFANLAEVLFAGRSRVPA